MKESVKTHFELTVTYESRNIKVVVQKISSELHRKVYAVWPKDEELEKYLGIVNLYFIQEVEKNNNDKPIIWYKVKYDFKSENNNVRDIQFEFAVWEQLSKAEVI
jgi:hypothetical protein